jgi:TRAP-type mannitol/chloroaromatic compound transport system substrate-binding protein
VNAKQWASLPKPFQEALDVACTEANVSMLARYDAKNTEALRRLVGQKAQLRAFPPPVMDACYKVAQELYAEFSGKYPEFKKIYGPWNRFREDQYLWFKVAENHFDNFVYSLRR